MAVRGAAGIADTENVGLIAKRLAANPMKKSLFIKMLPLRSLVYSDKRWVTELFQAPRGALARFDQVGLAVPPLASRTFELADEGLMIGPRLRFGCFNPEQASNLAQKRMPLGRPEGYSHCACPCNLPRLKLPRIKITGVVNRDEGRERP